MIGYPGDLQSGERDRKAQWLLGMMGKGDAGLHRSSEGKPVEENNTWSLHDEMWRAEEQAKLPNPTFLTPTLSFYPTPYLPP